MRKLKKLKKISYKELKYVKYLYMNQIPAAISNILRKSGIKDIQQDYLDVIYKSIADIFYGGCEPEFSSEESFKQFEEFFNSKNYRYICEGDCMKVYRDREYTRFNSPYKDKTIPFLIFVKDYQWIKYKREELLKRKEYEHTKKY